MEQSVEQSLLGVRLRISDIKASFESRHVRKPYYRHNTFGHPPYCRQLRYQPIRMSTAGHMTMTKTGPSQIPKASSHKFAIEKNFRHLMVKGQKEKIERLYKVKIEFLDKDESGQWVEIKGDIIDRRNAKIYCNSVCNPTTCSLVKLPEPLFQKCIEQIEHHTNASIKKVGNLGQYKVSGNSSSMALALSILSDVKDSGVLGTPAGNVWSATGKCSLTDAISKQNEKGEGKDENLSASSKGAARNSNSEVNSRSNNDNTDEMGRNIDPISTATQTNLEKAEDNEKTGKAKTLSKNLFAPENLVDKQDTQMCLSKGEESVAEKSSQSELDKKDTVEGKPLDAEEHEVKESALDFSLPFENTSFSHDVIQSKKKSRASKRLSMSLLSLLNASNARMDKCLEAPDTVKRAILSCLESEDNREITEDGVTLIDNDEDEDKCVDMSQIVISDEDDDDNDITVITLDETLVEVNNNESESEIQNDDIEHDYLRTNGATRDTDPENINSTKEEISENHEHISYIILDETIAEENKDPEISKCSDEHVDESVNTDVANKNKEAKNAKPSDNISGEIDEGGNDKTFITLDEYVEEGHADKSGNEKCADKDNSPNTNATTKDTKSEHVLKPEKEASKKSSEVCDELISSESVEENKENASSVKESGDSQNIDSNDNMVEKLDDKMIAKFTALKNKHKQMGEKKSSQKENIDCDAPKDVSIVLIDISDVSESNDEKSDSNKNKKMTTEAKKTSSDVSLPDEKSLEEGEIISSGSEEVGGTKIIGERKKRKSGNKVESKDVISKTKKIKLSKISHKYLPERYRTPYYNRAEAKMKEKEQKDKTEAVDNVANKEKKRKKKKRKRKVEVIEIPSQSSDDSETFSKKVRKADVSRTPEVTHTSDRDVRLVHVARTPEPFSKFDRERDAGRKLVPRTPMTPYLIGQSSLATRDKRYIVIDGSNVAMSHGNGKVFSCRGICLAVNYFRKRGHDLITVFLPQWRKCRPENPALMTEQHLLDKLEREGYLVFTPSRRIGRKLVAAYDDRFILELAEREDGIVVSNDNFRDLKSEKWSWRRVIEDRLLMYSFARDHFMVPEDPLGRHGPTLDRFLRH